MESAAVEYAKQAITMFGYVFAVGLFCSIIAKKLNVPDVVIYLLVGMLLGPTMVGLVNTPADSALNQGILIFGSCYILYDGGASLRFHVLKEVWITIVIISTIGILITASITAGAATYILGIPLMTALLMGATVASTDPATLVPVFRQVKIRDRVAQTVLSESAFNDAMGAIVTFTVLGLAMGSGEFTTATIGHAVIDLLKQAVIGLVVGSALGYAIAFLIAHKAYSYLEEYAAVASVMAVIASYMIADAMGGSGFMAVFVFGIMMGNKETFGFEMPEEEAAKFEHYVLNTALKMRMFIFILLGAQVDFGLMNQHLWGGIAVVTVLMLVARPVTVFLCALPDRRAKWSFNEMLFMCWTRETGVIPGALAGMLIGMNAPGAKLIAAITFIAILMTILIQATTTAWLGRKLGLMAD